MTRQKLKQYYYINKEIEMWQRELDSIGLNSVGTGGGRSSMPGDPTAIEAARLEEIRETVRELQAEAMEIRYNVITHIKEEVTDPQLRIILVHRFLYLESWEQVAREVGGGNTADSVRKRISRTYPD